MISPFRHTLTSWDILQSRPLIEFATRHDAGRRTALLYVPRHFRQRRLLPLVLVFHGGGSGPEAVAKASLMHRIAEREGFIVAYPAGTPGKSGLTWAPAGRSQARLTGDTRFVGKLIDDLARKYPIDRARIFAAGFSIGGSLVYELAHVMADKLAGVAIVSGTMTASYPDPSLPVPLIHVHGKKDRRVPFEGGRGTKTSGVKQWLPVQGCIDRWCRINACADEPQIFRSAKEGVTGYKFEGKADVELWVLEDGFHAWPGSVRLAAPDPKATSRETPKFSASERIWSFFTASKAVDIDSSSVRLPATSANRLMPRGATQTDG